MGSACGLHDPPAGSGGAGMIERGKFIVLDGIDGCGKSTQTRLLTDWLRGMDISARSTFEPGGTVLGAKLRQLLLHDNIEMSPLAEMMVFCADRAEHLETVVVPYLQAGACVVCDRFSAATYAYQVSGSEMNYSIQAFLDADHAARCALWQGTGQWYPDLMLILDLDDPGEGMRRKGKRPDKIEGRGAVYHQRVAEGFRFYGRGHLGGAATVISAAGTVEEVHARIVEQVKPLVLTSVGAS